MVIFHSFLYVYQRIFVVSPFGSSIVHGLFLAGTEVQGEKLAPEAKARHFGNIWEWYTLW
jgi:hypothetical protein